MDEREKHIAEFIAQGLSWAARELFPETVVPLAFSYTGPAWEGCFAEVRTGAVLAEEE